MYRYAYDNCPVCGLTFTENDDVVVCPICGTPHHRECYKNSGGCANSSKHDEGFEFVSAAPIEKEPVFTKNPNPTESRNTDNDDTSQENNPFESDHFTSPFGHVITDSETIENVPVGDIKKFIGPAWIYYIPLFYAKVKGLRIFRINFSALIGSYAWLLARKFYFLGFITALITFASYLFMDFYEAYAVYSGLELSVNALLSSENTMVMLGYYAYAFISNVPFILSVIIGIFANKLYMKKSIKKIKKINHSSKTAEQFNSRLSKKGGLNIVLLFFAGALYISYFILSERGVINTLMTQLINYLF